VQQKRREWKVHWRTLEVWEAQLGCSSCLRSMLDPKAPGQPCRTAKDCNLASLTDPIPANMGMVVVGEDCMN